MIDTSKVKSGGELIENRDESVLNTAGGSIIFKSTGANKGIHISIPNGSNLLMTEKVTSELVTVNKQSNILGSNFESVAGDKFTSVGLNEEQRVQGDITLMTGSDKLLNSTLGQDWLDTNEKLAAAKAKPNFNYTTIGNNTGAVYEGSGKPNPETGAIQGGSFQEQDNGVPKIAEEIAGDLANLEREMGTGGNMRFMSGKHMFLLSGPAAVKYDSGTMTPNKKEITKCVTIQDGKPTEIKTSTSVYENADTSGAVPFGDISISAGGKLTMKSGSGGFDFKSAGEANLNTTGRLTLGGAEVAIGGGDQNNAGRVTIISDNDLFMKADTITTRVAPGIIDRTSTDGQHTFINKTAFFTGDVIISGDLFVCGSIVAKGDITAGGEGGVSLLKHTHGGICPGSGNTDPPNK